MVGEKVHTQCGGKIEPLVEDGGVVSGENGRLVGVESLYVVSARAVMVGAASLLSAPYHQCESAAGGKRVLIVQLVHQVMCALKCLGGDVARRSLLCVQSVIMVVAVVVVGLEVEEVGFAKRMADEELSRQDISLTVLAGADGRCGEYGRGILCRQERQTLGYAVVHQLGLGVKACLLAVEIGSEDAVMGARVPLAVGLHGCFFSQTECPVPRIRCSPCRSRHR